MNSTLVSIIKQMGSPNELCSLEKCLASCARKNLTFSIYFLNTLLGELKHSPICKIYMSHIAVTSKLCVELVFVEIPFSTWPWNSLQSQIIKAGKQRLMIVPDVILDQ